MNQRDNLGDEIKDIIQDVLNTNNFNRLNKDIGRTVGDALRDMESMFMGRPPYPNPDPDMSWEPLSKEEPPLYHKEWEARTQKAPEEEAMKRQPFFRSSTISSDSKGSVSSVSSVSSVFLMVFGFLGVGIFGCALAGYGIFSTISHLNATINSITVGFILIFLVISAILAANGIKMRKRINRFRRYIDKIKGRSYCNVKELSETIGKTEKFVATDLQKMIHLGYFPCGHLDKNKTCIMLDEAAYEQYLAMEKWTKEQAEMTERQRQDMEKQQEQTQNENEAQRALRNTIEEGKSYIEQIRKANDDIPGEEVSQKLDRLEAVTSKIFQHIQTHPEQIAKIRKFMNYYLPTTLKLTNAYKELDNQPIAGENISTAKNEIQKTLDTINLAFEQLLDNLFYHAAMDISTEISALETMLAQEGLTEKDFTVKK